MKTSTKIFLNLFILLIIKNISAQVIIDSQLNPTVNSKTPYEYVTINSRSTIFYNELQWNFNVSDSAQKTFQYSSPLIEPIADGTFTFQLPAAPAVSLQTDAAGFCMFDILPAGTYTVTALKATYVTQSFSMVISTGVHSRRKILLVKV
ncbi:MAG: carboxypeptidase-like regulatory domain-containing protein [Chitinophagales bacterium]|nr:carboxypeptidase-like regulatory domain-containing protein [Chitinophagales bacterium]